MASLTYFSFQVSTNKGGDGFSVFPSDKPSFVYPTVDDGKPDYHFMSLATSTLWKPNSNLLFQKRMENSQDSRQDWLQPQHYLGLWQGIPGPVSAAVPP